MTKLELNIPNPCSTCKTFTVNRCSYGIDFITLEKLEGKRQEKRGSVSWCRVMRDLGESGTSKDSLPDTPGYEVKLSSGMHIWVPEAIVDVINEKNLASKEELIIKIKRMSSAEFLNAIKNII